MIFQPRRIYDGFIAAITAATEVFESAMLARDDGTQDPSKGGLLATT